jgi:uncharacterized protein
MGEMFIHDYVKKDIENAMVIISFPTVGLVSSIAANYIISNLKLKLIGSIISNDFYPAAIVQNGIPTSPVRIFAGEHECGPEGDCDQIVVIISELPVKTSAYTILADKILEWCKNKKCKLMVTLEGVNSQDPSGENIQVFHVGSNENANNITKNLPSESFDLGMVSGLSGILLYKGAITDFKVICLLAEAHIEYPDSRSAAEVLKVLDKMVPQISMDPEPLLAEAKKIEEKMKSSMAQIKPYSPNELPDIPPGMYG